MAGNRLSKYEIDLEIKESDETRSNISEIEKSLKNIGESARDNIAQGLKDASNQADVLINKVNQIASSEGDATKEIEAFNKASNKAISDLEKQYTILNYSLSYAGKAQRQRLAQLEEEKKKLDNTKEAKKREKEIDKEISKIKKDVIVGSDNELSAALENNRAIRAKLKLTQQDAKLLNAQAKYNKSMISYAKDDLKAIREKIRAQFKFIETLKTTAGWYNLIKKGAKAAAKGASIAAAGIAGGAIALGGAAIASAGSQVDREREANRIKANISNDEKNSLLGEMYIKTGADYTTIVDAINRVTSVLGVNDRDGIAQAAVAEIRYPGAAAMFRQQNTGKASASDFSAYANRIKAIQGATGASVEQIQSSTDRIANLRQRNFSNASMTDLQSIYLSLQGSGAYDTQDELDRAFNSFLRAQRNTNENIFDFAQKYFTSSKTQTRGVWGATNKQQAMNALSTLDWARIRGAANVNDSSMSTTAAEDTAATMRKFEESKMMLLQNVVKVLGPIMKKLGDFIDSSEGQKFVDSITDFFTKTIAKLVDWLDQLVQDTHAIREKATGGIEIVDNGDGTATMTTTTRGLGRGGWFANGGITTMPSIAGERGPEMVVPLDYSRSARGAQLTQNLVQHFNMSGNETTALSLSQAVRSRDFTRAMMNNAWLSGRLGR